MSESSPVAALPASSWLGAFANRPFAIVWGAETLGLIGIAVYDAAAGWLMTSLNSDPIAVSAVQVAAYFPMFLFTYPAGALADMFDARRFLITVSGIIVAMMIAFAALVQSGHPSTMSLLLTTFVLSMLWALNAPAWMSIAPLLVPRKDLDSAIAANSVGYNISRAVGPTLGAFTIATLGIAAPFWMFCFSNLAMIAALIWWRAPKVHAGGLRAERFTSALRVGLRHAANNPDLIAALVRTGAIFPFASAYWALLPLLARRTAEGAQVYGMLLAAISIGAIFGSFAYASLKERLGANGLVLSGSTLTALALALFGLGGGLPLTLCACLLAGASWIIVLTTVYVAAQDALPAWVRGRGIAILLTVVFGAMSAGGALWGEIATLGGPAFAFYAASVGALIAIPLVWRWRLISGAKTESVPPLHWPTPKFDLNVQEDQGPVLVSIEYLVRPAQRHAFLSSLDDIRRMRARDGAFAWGMFEDGGADNQFRESFMIESWNEFLHVRERFTKTDVALEIAIQSCLSEPPRIGIHISARQISDAVADRAG